MYAARVLAESMSGPAARCVQHWDDTRPTATHMPTSLTWGKHKTAARGCSDHGRDAGAQVGEGPDGVALW